MGVLPPEENRGELAVTEVTLPPPPPQLFISTTPLPGEVSVTVPGQNLTLYGYVDGLSSVSVTFKGAFI